MAPIKTYEIRCKGPRKESHKLTKSDFIGAEHIGNLEGAFSLIFPHIKCGDCKNVSLDLADLVKSEKSLLRAFMEDNFKPQEVERKPSLEKIFRLAMKFQRPK